MREGLARESARVQQTSVFRADTTSVMFSKMLSLTGLHQFALN